MSLQSISRIPPTVVKLNCHLPNRQSDTNQLKNNKISQPIRRPIVSDIADDNIVLNQLMCTIISVCAVGALIKIDTICQGSHDDENRCRLISKKNQDTIESVTKKIYIITASINLVKLSQSMVEGMKIKINKFYDSPQNRRDNGLVAFLQIGLPAIGLIAMPDKLYKCVHLAKETGAICIFYLVSVIKFIKMVKEFPTKSQLMLRKATRDKDEYVLSIVISAVLLAAMIKVKKTILLVQGLIKVGAYSDAIGQKMILPMVRDRVPNNPMRGGVQVLDMYDII